MASPVVSLTCAFGTKNGFAIPAANCKQNYIKPEAN